MIQFRIYKAGPDGLFMVFKDAKGDKALNKASPLYSLIAHVHTVFEDGLSTFNIPGASREYKVQIYNGVKRTSIPFMGLSLNIYENRKKKQVMSGSIVLKHYKELTSNSTESQQDSTDMEIL